MSGLPSGTITFLFADVEGSTDLVQRLGDEEYAGVLAEYLRACRRAVEAHGGHEVDTEGDGYFAAFARATDAVEAAIAMQVAFRSTPWPPAVSLRVRIGMHTGEPIATRTGYVGVDVHRAARISAAAWGGQVLISHATQALLSQSLPADVSLLDLGQHRLKDLREAEHLYQVVHPDLLQGFSPPRSLSARLNNLPIQLTSFIGREREIADIERTLADSRLVTLTGFGGVGKTRLALQVAADVLERFSDGVWLVELDTLSDEALVPQAVASALGVREESGRNLIQTLLAFLRSRTLLLLLDNCEHLIEASARIVQSILQQVASVRILATSREPLGVAGEVIRQVAPLSLPDGSQVPLDRLRAFEAVRLFMDRAAMARPEFTLTPENGPTIVHIAQRLEGVPLAIELAAARVKALSLSDVSRRLDDALGLLTAGARTAVPRHQTLKAAIDWSHELLSNDERIVLRRAAAFRGGFGLEAAVAVCGEGFSPLAVPEIFWALVEKSFLLVDAQAEASRYRLLDIIRQYGRAKAEAAGEWPVVLDRHLAFFRAMATQAAREMRGAQEQLWLDRLELEHDNLSAALERAHVAGDGEPLLELACALERFWLIRGYWSEGRQWLEAGLDAAGAAPATLRARGLTTLAQLASSQGDYEHAAAFGTQGLALHRELADHQGIAKCLAMLGNIAYQRGDYAAAGTYHSDSLAEAREAGAAYEAAAALLNLAIVADHQGEFGRATALCRESLSPGGPGG
jgi:predicted ATPase/class 3 adenylate cyclase